MKQIYVIQFCSCVQHIIHVMHKGVHWTQESRRPDYVWAEWMPNTFPFRNLASEFSVFGQENLGFIFVFYFGQIVTRKKTHVFWQIVTRTQSHVILNLSNMNSFLFNQWEWNNLFMYFVFSFFLIFFLYKKISGDSTPFTQKKEGVFQSTQKSLF